jgi:hypothetical protein
MAAGGFKTFTTGEVLTAADTNNFLMQGVLVFDDAAARDAAITAPVEGQVVYLKDTNAVLSYDGTSYVGVGGSSPLTTKGDLYTFSTSDTRLGVGANGTVLTAASGEATGLQWAAPSAGGANWSILNSGGTALTGAATVTVSGISGKDKILVLFDQASSASGASSIGVRFNTDTASNYYRYGATVANSGIGQRAGAAASFEIGLMSSNAASRVSGYLLMSGANASGVKQISLAGSGSTDGSSDMQAYMLGGYYDSSSTISSVSAFSSTGNLDSGTMYIYTSA